MAILGKLEFISNLLLNDKMQNWYDHCMWLYHAGVFFLKKKYLPNINYSTEKNVNKRLTENRNGKFFLYTKF